MFWAPSAFPFQVFVAWFGMKQHVEWRFVPPPSQQHQWTSNTWCWLWRLEHATRIVFRDDDRIWKSQTCIPHNLTQSALQSSALKTTQVSLLCHFGQKKSTEGRWYEQTRVSISVCANKLVTGPLSCLSRATLLFGPSKPCNLVR